MSPAPQEPAADPGPEAGAAAASGEPLLPPRPNLGPEPWQDRGAGAWWAAAGVAAVLVLLALVARARRRRTRPIRPSPPIGRAGPADAVTPAGLLVERAEAIRGALIATFGPSWAARTTEEIAGSPELADRLGLDDAGRVVALLAEADRAKFAGGVPDDGQGEAGDLDRWVASVIAALADAGATSTSNGR